MRGFFDVPRDGMSHLAWNIAAPERCGKPVICAMEKFAFGVGFELSLACDFRLATEETRLGLPEVTIGQMPGSGGTHRLADRILRPWGVQLDTVDIHGSVRFGIGPFNTDEHIQVAIDAVKEIAQRESWKRLSLVGRHALPGRVRSWIWCFRTTG